MLKFKLEATSISSTVNVAGLVMLAADVADLRELRRLGEKPVGRKTFGRIVFLGRQTIGRQARTVRRQQIGRLGDIFQTVGRNV